MFVCLILTGKGKNIWDTRTETPSNIAEGGTGQIACDSYHKYKEDVQMLKAMGVSHTCVQ